MCDEAETEKPSQLQHVQGQRTAVAAGLVAMAAHANAKAGSGACHPPAPPARTAKSAFLPFDKALLYARSLKLKSTRAWEAWRKGEARPANIPTNPDKVYKHDGWQGWGHWLGTGNVGVAKDRQFLPFKKALLYARLLKLKTRKEWQAWCKTGARPATIPSAPDKIYKKDGWQGWGHWHGQRCQQKPEILAVQEGAAVSALPQAREPESVAGVARKKARGSPGQQSL